VVAIKTQVHSGHFQSDRKPTIDDVQNDLNKLDAEGWELAGIQNVSLQDTRLFTIAYLKKPRL